MNHTYLCRVYSWKVLQPEDRYYVGASSEREAKAMLTAYVDPSHIQDIQRVTDGNGNLIAPSLDRKMGYHQISRA